MIVEKSPLDKMYEGLPVVIVDNYNDITAADLDRWLKMYLDVMSNKKYQEKLKRGYWESLIKSHFYS